MNCPPLETQRKIAGILSAYDDLIENNRRRIAILERMAEELYREWFVRMRFPGYQNTKFVKGVPEGWELGPIATVCTFLSGYAFKSETYSSTGQYGIVTIKNVHDGYFDPECTDRIATTPHNLKKHCYLNVGDILMSLTGNVGRVCRVTAEGLLLNQRVAKLESNHSTTQNFVYYFFRNKSIQTLAEMIATGAAQPNLSPVKLSQQKVVMPTVSTMQKFHRYVQPLVAKASTLLIQNSVLASTRNTALGRLISGKTNVDGYAIRFPTSMLAIEQLKAVDSEQELAHA